MGVCHRARRPAGGSAQRAGHCSDVVRAGGPGSFARNDTPIGGRPALDRLGHAHISARSPLYNPAGYHFGSVWPLFTGWASVGEYRYHAADAGYANLKRNAWLALDGAGGNTTEVLSGDVYSPLSTASSHQTWSAAMVVSPLLRGLFGLEVNASTAAFHSNRICLRIGFTSKFAMYRWRKARSISLFSATIGRPPCTYGIAARRRSSLPSLRRLRR